MMRERERKKEKYRWISVYVYMRISTYTSLLCTLRGPGSNDKPVAMSSPCTQILAYKCHSLLKLTRAPEKIADFRAKKASDE